MSYDENPTPCRLTVQQAQYLKHQSPTQRRAWAKAVTMPQALEKRLDEAEPTGYISLREAIASGDVEVACQMLAESMLEVGDA